jgi:hypothetical protein
MILSLPPGRQHLLHQQAAIHESAHANILKAISDVPMSLDYWERACEMCREGD